MLPVLSLEFLHFLLEHILLDRGGLSRPADLGELAAHLLVLCTHGLVLQAQV